MTTKLNEEMKKQLNSAELQAKRDIAVREANDNAGEAIIKCYDKLDKLLNKFNIKFHTIDVNQYCGTASISESISPEEFLKKYGHNGKLFKISDKQTKKFKYSIGGLYNRKYVQDEAMAWFSDNIDEDYKRTEKLLNRKAVKNIIAEIKAINDNKEAIIARYDAQIKKARSI